MDNAPAASTIRRALRTLFAARIVAQEGVRPQGTVVTLRRRFLLVGVALIDRPCVPPKPIRSEDAHVGCRIS